MGRIASVPQAVATFLALAAAIPVSYRNRKPQAGLRCKMHRLKGALGMALAMQAGAKEFR